MYFSEAQRINLKENEHQASVQATYYAFLEEQSAMNINLADANREPEPGGALM